MLDLTVDPLGALWEHQGRPCPRLPWKHDFTTCSRCGKRTAQAVDVADVVSEKFTGWDPYANGDPRPRWCTPCAWGHSTPHLRTTGWVITVTGAQRATGPALFTVLSQPLPSDVAVVVPLTGKKHVLPDARWGMLQSEDLSFGWTGADAERLAALVTLRSLGFSEAALRETAPRWEALRRASVTDQGLAIGLWPMLALWRSTPPLMAVALRATRDLQ